jgi:hypothetical protein
MKWNLSAGTHLKESLKLKPEKAMLKILLRVSMLMMLVQLIACDDEQSTETDTKRNLLTTNTWGTPVVTHADGNLSADYSDFAITFTTNAVVSGFEGTYIVSNGGHAFEDPSGQWKLNEDQTMIIFDSGREIQFEISEGHLKLDFTVIESGGRSNGLSGHFVFELKPL